MSGVFIATPAYDEWVSIEHASALFEGAAYLALAGIEMSHSIAPGNPFIDIARNELVEEFLRSDAEDLLFVDADVGFDAKALTRVLAYEEEIVGGLVPKRDAKSDSSYHSNALTGRMSASGLIECKELPTAFMRIKRGVFDKLERPYFKTGSNPKDFGEDIYFCRKWCALGGSLWIDADLTFSHRGGKVWKGNFYDHAVKSGLLIKAEAA